MGIWKSPEKSPNAPYYEREYLASLIPNIQQYIKKYNQRKATDYKLAFAFVFGSYQAGAEKCHDLDIAFIVDPKWHSYRDMENDGRLIFPKLAREKIQRELHKISPAIEAHFLNGCNRDLIHFGLFNNADKTMAEKDENQPYMFTGPHETIYPPRPLKIPMAIHVGATTITDSFFHSIISTEVFGMLSCYYCRGLAERDEEGNTTFVDVEEFGRLGGFDVSLVGVVDEQLKDAFAKLILGRMFHD